MPRARAFFSAYRDIDEPPLFRSALLRSIWRIYTQRFTRAGRWFFWPSGVFVAYAGASSQIQAYIPAGYVIAFWAVAIGAMLMFRPRVRLRSRHADRVCAGESLPVDIDIEHARRPGADQYVIPHRLPRGVGAEPEEGAPIPPPSADGSTRVRLSLRCWKRGVYTLRGYRVESDFPAALLHGRRIFAQDRALVVYPRFSPLSALRLPTGRRYHPGGVALASNLGESFEYIGNREYRDGDSIRDIDWRATARLNRPIVREYRDEYYLRVAVILDTHIPAGGPQGARDCFEQAVSLSASVSDYMARQEYLVDLFAAGPNLYHLTAGRSLAYLDQILDILACVDENPSEPFQTIEPEIMESLSKITTVICVFLDWNDTRRAFVHRLARQGAGVKAIIVRDGACSVDPAGDYGGEAAIAVVSSADAQRGLEEL